MRGRVFVVSAAVCVICDWLCDVVCIAFVRLLRVMCLCVLFVIMCVMLHGLFVRVCVFLCLCVGVFKPGWCVVCVWLTG